MKNKFVRKSLKILGWTLGIFILLVLLLLIAIQLPFVQNFAKDQAVQYLQEKIKTKVEIEYLAIAFPNNIELKKVYLEQQNGDTLLFANNLKVDISLFEILSNKVEINAIDLQGLVAKIDKSENGTFNFNYILEAFSSDKPKDTTATPMVFDLKKINLDKIVISYNDASQKNKSQFKLDHFDTNIERFNLDALDFKIPNITIAGLHLSFDQDEIPEIINETIDDAVQKSRTITPKVDIQQISLEDIKLNYRNGNQKIESINQLQNLLVKVEKIDLENQIVALQTIEVNELNALLKFDKKENKKVITTTKKTTEAESKTWDISLQTIDLEKINLQFDDENYTPQTNGIDYKHIDLMDFNFKANSISFKENELLAKIDQLQLQEKSGLKINELQSEVFYGKNQAFLKNLYLATDKTILKDQLIVGYKSIDDISKNLKNLQLDAQLKGSEIAIKDILLFAPDLAKTNPFKSNPNSIIYLNSSLAGTVGNLKIPSFQLSGIGSTYLDASGKIVGLPDVASTYFDMKINRISTTKKDLNAILPAGTLPQNISLPNSMTLKGSFKGSTNNFNTNLNLATSDGIATIDAQLNMLRKNHEIYKATIATKNLNIGKIIKNDSIGTITAIINAKGSSFDPKMANAVISGHVSQAYFKRYNYSNLDLKGSISQGKAIANIVMNDPNLRFNLDADGDLNSKYPKAKLKLNLDIADLKKLNLHAGPLKLRGDIIADIPTADLDFLNADVIAKNIRIDKEIEEYILDSLAITARANDTLNSVMLRSQFVNADIIGKYTLSKLPNSIKKSLQDYYTFPIDPKDTTTVAQRIKFDIKTKDHQLLYKLIPSLTEFQSANINGLYDTTKDSIFINGDIPRLVFGTTRITKGKIDINNDNNQLNYSVKVNPIESGSMQIPSVNVSGNVKNNVVNYMVLLQDAANKNQYNIAGTFEQIDGENNIKILPENLLLNYENWSIPTSNEIRLGNKMININDFVLSKDQNKLKIQSQKLEKNAPIEISFSDFEINTLTNIIQMENLDIKGKLQGDVLLKNVLENPTFTSDLTIADFMFGKDTVGNIHVKVDNEVANLYRANVVIDGLGNDVVLKGNYQDKNKSLDLKLDINKLMMSSIQGFTMGNLKDSRGFISGKFDINGPTATPSINGNVTFNEVGFTVTPLSSTFKDISETININNDKIAFNNFLIKDEDDNLLQIVGNIYHKTFSDFKFDLGINADNFKAVNSEESDNSLYYGLLMIDCKLKIKGDFNKPIIDGNIKINKDTKFSIALPQSDPSLVDREGIVEFVDVANPTVIKKVDVKDQVNTTSVKGIEAAVNIEIVPEAELSLIIDKGSGDYLKLKGDAQLSGGIDPSGKTTLTGRYEFVEGTYEMSFNFIKRKFDIQKGSYILWKGEPTAADVNITAVYRTETAPIDLLDGLDPTQQNQFKQKMVFDTQLKMNGELLKPEISFDIVLPEGKNNVSSLVLNTTETKLAQLRQQQTELDKQVFALLLLNRFIGENPFASQAGGADAESIARQSASKILSQQLNNLASDLIEGIEIDFDLESQEDYTSGEKQNRTDLNVSVSKRLLDDRLKVTVGSSFGLEGPEQDQRDANNIAGDVSLEYQLTKDGKYTVRAYRKNKYQVALQGQVVETGVAFIITLDYNKFKELFHRSKEKKNKNVNISKDEKDE